jgi:integrase
MDGGGELHGWHPDPFGRFEERYFIDGQASALVRDGDSESQDSQPALTHDPSGTALDAWTPSSPSQHFRRLRSKVPGLEETTLHDLRHFHVTQLLVEGLDLASVAHRVGHGGGGRTTLAVYAHSMPSSDKRAAEIRGALFAKKTEPEVAPV